MHLLRSLLAHPANVAPITRIVEDQRRIYMPTPRRTRQPIQGCETHTRIKRLPILYRADRSPRTKMQYNRTYLLGSRVQMSANLAKDVRI